MPKKYPWESTDKANDADPNPRRRTGSLAREYQYADYNAIRVNDEFADQRGYVEPNLGGEWELPSAAPQAPGPRRGVYAYEKRPSTHPPAPGKIGAE